MAFRRTRTKQRKMQEKEFNYYYLENGFVFCVCGCVWVCVSVSVVSCWCCSDVFRVLLYIREGWGCNEGKGCGVWVWVFSVSVLFLFKKFSVVFVCVFNFPKNSKFSVMKPVKMLSKRWINKCVGHTKRRQHIEIRKHASKTNSQIYTNEQQARWRRPTKNDRQPMRNWLFEWKPLHWVRFKSIFM